MPVVFRYKSFKFFFYSVDENPREAMHIHVRGAEGEAKFCSPPLFVWPIAQDVMRIEKKWHEHFAQDSSI